MISSVMTTTYVMAGLFVLFLIAYIILKVLAYSEKMKPRELSNSKSVPTQIKIVSKDLQMQAENLIATHDVYARQISMLVSQISEIEKSLDRYYLMKKFRNSLNVSEMIGNGSAMITSDTDAEYMEAKSLKLQEQKCKLEAKILKIMKQLDDIAKEEYRRQTSTNQ